MRSSLLVALALAAVPVRAQTEPAAPKPHRMEIRLQRLEAGEWKSVDPGLVFARDDRVRFHYRANFDGFLYVMNYSSSGQYERLFPSEEAGRDNHVTAGSEYTVPATRAAFRIAGPAGHETIYWLVSPVELSVATPALRQTTPKAARPEDLMPRCDDEILRARGDCIDSSAGPRGVPNGDDLPRNLAASGAVTPRDLLIMREENTTVVASPNPLTGPVVYEFRLAHR